MDNFSLGHEIKKISHLIKRLLAHKGHDEHLTPFQIEVLFFIKNSDKPVYQKDIEKEFGLSRPSVSLGLDGMEKSLLIERKTCSNDARLKEIILTKKAVDKSKSITECFIALESSLVCNISKEELVVVQNVFSKIYQNAFNIMEEDK